ncbi:hypothetical protein BLNAU_17317 [Blattamonas nauphoetae]|uniref:Protein kinase domain-containing protein n=1 Tax=Blattamonas nauphoetae TaxID=2049346 RepID=A0ABQ9X910_9EUKA|nr:hypothetical protein BLNAU_17317 [Blattamonas nauphoetae]
MENRSTSVQSTLDRTQFSSQQDAQHFENCHFTSTKPTSSFNIIEYSESSVTFSRSDGVISSGSQFTFVFSPNTHFASSNFTAPPTSASTGTRTPLLVVRRATTGYGSCLYDSLLLGHPRHIVNFPTQLCSFSRRVTFLYFTNSRMFHCHFDSNSAGQQGGAVLFSWPRFEFRGCPFCEQPGKSDIFNKQHKTRSLSGNDIGVVAGNANEVLNTMIGCTSTSVSPKIGFYYDTITNGNVTNEEVYFPNPTNTSLPTAAGEWWMSEDGSGETCSEATPCNAMSAVSAAISSSETTKTGWNKVNVGVGLFSESVSPLSLSVEFVGSGWDRNSSTSTTVELSLSVDGNANFSLTSLSPPLTPRHHRFFEWNQQQQRFDWRMFGLKESLRTTLTSSRSPISLTGSCSLTMTRCWVMEIERKRGDGGSVIDSSTSGTISLSQSDFARCVSSGCSGCLSFSSSLSSSAVKLSSVYFSDNVGNETDQAGISNFANDLSFSGFGTKQISMSAVQSISPQPHCLTNSSNSSFDSIPLQFSDQGIDFPVSPRFDRGTPLSRFTSLNELFMSLEAKQRVTITLKTAIQQPLRAMSFDTKKITISGPPILLDLQPSQTITLLDSSYFQLHEFKLSVPTSLTTTPFILESSSAQLTFWVGSIIFSELSHSAALVRNNGGFVTICGTSITKNLLFEGHSFIESVGGSFTAQSILFDSISSTSDGAVLKAKGTIVKFTMASCVNCSARNGGALAVELSGASYLQLLHESASSHNATFKDCMAIGEGGARTDPKGKGGAIFVNGSSTSAKPIQLSTTTTDDARFEENFAGEGNDIFVSRSVFGGKSLDSISGFGGGSHSEDFRVVVEGLDSNEKERDVVQAKLLPSPKVSVNGSIEDDFGKVSGLDTEACKWTSSFCATLGYGVRFLTQRYLNGSSIPQTIQFLHNMTYTETKIEIVGQDVTVCGTTSKDLSKSTISRSLVLIDSSISSGSFLFSVQEKGKLRVTNLDINCDSSSGVFDLTSTGSSLWIEEIGLVCSVGPTHSCPLIRVQNGQMQICGSVINTTHGSSGSASFSSPILSCLSPSASISLSSTIFSSFCSSCVLVEMTTNEAISMKSVSFVDCSRSDSGDTLVLVSSSNLDLVVTPSLWEDSFTPTTSLTRFMSHNTNVSSSDEFYEWSLLFYLLVPSESIVCGSSNDEASTHPRCGSDRLRCSSIDSAIHSAMNTHLKTILVKTDVVVEDAVSVTASVEIKPDTATIRKVMQTGSSSLEVDGLSAVLSLSSLAFSFSSTNTLVSFFVVKTGTLSLSSCRIGEATTPQTLSSSMTSLFAVSSSGVLTLVSTTISNVRFSHPTSGSLIDLSLGASLNIDASSEVSEIWSNGKGMIVFVESESLESTASLDSFQTLKKSITIPSTGSFSDSDKNDFVGKEGSIEESLLWHWFPHTASNSTVVVSLSGEDNSKCGLSLLPCHSVEHGFASLKNSNSLLVLENDDSLSSPLTTKLTSQTISSQTNRQTLTVTSSGSFSVSADTSLGLLSLSFVSTVASSSVSLSGSVVSGRIVSGKKVEIGESEKETLFQSCSSLVDGGGMNVEVTGSGSVVISKTEFEDCSAVRGGSIFLTLTRLDEQTSWSFDVSGSSFISSSSSSNTDMAGANIFISGSFFESSITTNLFPEVSRTSDPNGFWGVDSESGVNSSLLVYLVPISDEVVVDGIGGSDIGCCGHFGVSCSSIEKGLARAVPQDSSVTLLIRNTTSLTTPLTVSEFSLTFTGESPSQQVPVSSNGCFRLETGQLSLALIDFVSSILSSSTSFISVSSGASLAISSCSFDSFASSCSGSVVSATVTDSSSLSVDSCSFTNCTSTSSFGSGVLDISLSLASTFTLSGSTVIDSCLSPSADSDFIVIRHPSLGKAMIESSLTLAWEKDSSTIRSFVGKEGTHPKVVPLFLYFSNLGSEGHVSGLWCDVSVCGFLEYPCETVPTLWTRMASHSSLKVILDGDIVHSEEMDLSKPLNVVGNDHVMDVGGVVCDGRKDGLFIITEDVSFTKTKLCISSTFEHTHLFDVVDKRLRMDGCLVSQRGTNTLGGSVMRVGEGASLVIVESLFSSIASSDELGGVVVGRVGDGAEFRLDNNTFKWCLCSGEANCVWMELKNESSTQTLNYSMRELFFEECSANPDEKEMNVLVVGRGLDTLITESKWEGSVDESNEWSIWVLDRQTGVNSSLLPYLIPISESVEVDGSGWEFKKCGHFHLFCRTVEFGLYRMESGSIEWMKIVDSVCVEKEIKLNGTLAFSGMKSSSSMIFSNAGSFVLSKAGLSPTSLTLSSLSFSVSSRSSENPLISSSDSTLTITSCSFSSTQTVLSPLIRMNEGLLKMEEVNVSDIETSCALIDTLSGVEIVGCCFESIRRSSNGPSVLTASPSSDHVVRVQSTRFLNCMCDGVAWWVFLRGEEGRVEKESDWEGTFNHSSPRSGVLVSREGAGGVVGGEDEVEEMVGYSLIYEFYPRGSEMFVLTSETSEDHVLCGNMKVACKTVDGGFSLTQERWIVIVGNGSLGSGMMVDGIDVSVCGYREAGRLLVVFGGQIVNGENDELDSVSVSSLWIDLDGSLLGSESGVSIISSSPLLFLSSFSSVDLSNLTVLDWAGSTLLSGVNGESNISISSSLFHGMDVDEERNSDDVCLWESGLLSFENCSVDIHSSEFSHLRDGALFVSGGSLTIHSTSFEDNSAKNSDFPSAHRNIRCGNGSRVTIESLNGGDGSKDFTSAWISGSSDCVVSGSVINPNSPFFVPSLTSSDCTSKTDKAKSWFNVSLVGTELLPCGLFLEVFEAESSSKFAHVDLSSLSTSKWNETSIVFSLSRSEHLSKLSLSEEWRGRVLFGNGERTAGWFVMKVSASAERKAEALNSMKWLLPLVGGVIVGIVILVIVLCVLVRRRKAKSKKETETKQMEEIDEVEIKMEDPEDMWRNGSQNALVVSSAHDPFSEMVDKTKQNPIPKEEDVELNDEGAGSGPAEVVVAMGCGSEKTNEVTVQVRETLYSRLHTPKKLMTTVERGRIQKRVSEGLALIARVRPTAEILSRLTSHWVLFDEKDEMFFRKEASEGMRAPTHQIHTNQIGESLVKQAEDEGQRWVPPEVADGKPVIDVVHGTVFRLGLMLWEIETGQIPFGEVDGINAQRQLGSGIVPRMDRVREGMAELVTDCLSIDPEKRPSMKSIVERVTMLNANAEEIEKMRIDLVNRDAFLLPSGSPPQSSPQHPPTSLHSPHHPSENPHLPPRPKIHPAKPAGRQ